MTSEVLQSVREGDMVAYKALYTDYLKKLFNYGRKFTDDATTVEDSVQEVFYGIWHKRKALPEVSALNAYLFSAFRHVLLRRLRRESKTVLSEHFETEAGFSIEQQLIQTEEGALMRRKIQTALDNLTPRQREAIFLRFYENLSFEEIAVILNITTKATYKLMARSLESLKEKLDPSMGALLLFMLAGVFS